MNSKENSKRSKLRRHNTETEHKEEWKVDIFLCQLHPCIPPFKIPARDVSISYLTLHI